MDADAVLSEVEGSQIEKMRFNIKKSDITASLIIIIVCVLLMIMLWLRTSDRGGTAPSYSFLAGRNPITCEKVNRGIEDRRYIYSFEADFNDLCSKADAELISGGFIGKNLTDKNFSGNEHSTRYYWLKGRFPHGPVWININNNLQYIDLHDLYTNVPKSNYALSEKDGWVMIEVIYGRGWQWPF